MAGPWERYGATQAPAKPWEKYGAAAVVEAAEKPQNFFQRVGDDIRARRENVGEIQAAKRRGEQGPIESGYQEAGQFAGLLNDIVGEGFQSLGHGVTLADQKLTGGKITTPIKEATGRVLNSVGNLPAFGGGTLAETVPQELRMLEENHPRAARNLKAGANIGAVLYAAKPVNGKDFVDSATRAVTPKIAPKASADQLRSIGGDLIGQASKSGAVINENAAAQFIDDITKEIAPRGKWEAAAKLKSEVDDIVDNLAQLRGQPMSLEDAMGLESRLGKMAYSPKNYQMGKFTPEGLQLRKIQETLSNMIDNAADNGLVAGDASAIHTWREGQKHWAASIRAREIENIIENAQHFDHPATSIRVGMRNLIKNKSKFNKYSKMEQALIRQAAKTGIVTDFYRLGASGLGPIVSGAAGAAAGGLVGGPVGATVGAAAAAGPSFAMRELSKGIATTRQTARANKALDAVVSGAVNAPTKKLTVKEIMALPPEQAKFYLQKRK